MRDELNQGHMASPDAMTEFDAIRECIAAVEQDMLLVLSSLPHEEARQAYEAFIDEQAAKLDGAALMASVLDESNRFGVTSNQVLPLYCSTFGQKLKAEFAQGLASMAPVTDAPFLEDHEQLLTDLMTELAYLRAGAW